MATNIRHLLSNNNFRAILFPFFKFLYLWGCRRCFHIEGVLGTQGRGISRRCFFARRVAEVWSYATRGERAASGQRRIRRPSHRALGHGEAPLNS